MMRQIRFFNTLTRKVEALEPITPGVVTLYTCGPTVYNYAHIGNLRTFLFQDLLRRTLRGLGLDVRHCMNITDVEDKIITASQGTLPSDASNADRHAAMKALTDQFTKAFFDDLEAAGIHIKDFTYLPKATAYVPQMIALVKTLEEKGLAYEREGSVYYRVSGLPHYGCLAHLDREGMKCGVSVDVDEYDRESYSDFVLWKSAKPGEPYWESPWGKGRPGWHIECSAMGMELLGERIDIHSGGVDLVFPHHENEIAQSEGVTGKQWVNMWVHGEFLLVEGEKMSKSLGNFFTLRDLKDKGVDPITFRYAIQSNHYRKLYNFSFDGLHAAKQSLERIRNFRRRMEEKVHLPPDAAFGDEAQGIAERVSRARDEFWSAMCDDLNTPEALAALFTLISDLNAQDDKSPLCASDRECVLAFLDETDAIFAGWPHEETQSLDAEVEALIEARRAAKAAKNWAEADSVRNQLKEMGILLEDKKDGTVSWKRA